MLVSVKQSFLLMFPLSVVMAGNLEIATAAIIDFEELSLPSPNSTVMKAFQSGGAEFPGQSKVSNCETCWHGWVYSNSTLNQDLSVDPSTLFFPANQQLSSQIFAAFVPPDGARSKYAVSSLFESAIDPATGRTAPRSPILLPVGESVVSIDIANTTYVAHSVVHGDAFNQPFEPDDEFTLTIIGEEQGSEVGRVNIDLVTRNMVLNNWTNVSLRPLTGADTLRFSLASTQENEFGITTPTYFALDNIVTKPTPLSGDMDDNGVVDPDDLNLVLFSWSHWASSIPLAWVNWRPSDYEQVGVDDLNAVLFNWKVSLTTVAIPEPTTARWILFCSVVALPCMLRQTTLEVSKTRTIC